MPSLTINDLPAPLLTRLRQRVAADRCSLNRAVIYLRYVQDTCKKLSLPYKKLIKNGFLKKFA